MNVTFEESPFILTSMTSVSHKRKERLGNMPDYIWERTALQTSWLVLFPAMSFENSVPYGTDASF